MVERLFLAVPWGCLRFVIVVFPDHTHLLFRNRVAVEESTDCFTLLVLLIVCGCKCYCFFLTVPWFVLKSDIVIRPRSKILKLGRSMCMQ